MEARASADPVKLDPFTPSPHVTTKCSSTEPRGESSVLDPLVNDERRPASKPVPIFPQEERQAGELPFSLASLIEEAEALSPLQSPTLPQQWPLLKSIKSQLQAHSMRLSVNLSLMRNSLNTLKERDQAINFQIQQLRSDNLLFPL